jgi:hypothetical protein
MRPVIPMTRSLPDASLRVVRWPLCKGPFQRPARRIGVLVLAVGTLVLYGTTESVIVVLSTVVLLVVLAWWVAETRTERE